MMAMTRFPRQCYSVTARALS